MTSSWHLTSVTWLIWARVYFVYRPLILDFHCTIHRIDFRKKMQWTSFSWNINNPLCKLAIWLNNLALWLHNVNSIITQLPCPRTAGQTRSRCTGILTRDCRDPWSRHSDPWTLPSGLEEHFSFGEKTLFPSPGRCSEGDRKTWVFKSKIKYKIGFSLLMR